MGCFSVLGRRSLDEDVEADEEALELDRKKGIAKRGKQIFRTTGGLVNEIIRIQIQFPFNVSDAIIVEMRLRRVSTAPTAVAFTAAAAAAAMAIIVGDEAESEKRISSGIIGTNRHQRFKPVSHVCASMRYMSSVEVVAGIDESGVDELLDVRIGRGIGEDGPIRGLEPIEAGSDQFREKRRQFRGEEDRGRRRSGTRSGRG